MEELIACISTPIGKGAISIVRMSGKGALETASKLFYSKNLNYKTIEPRKLYLGDFNLGREKEKCMMVYFKAPNSYTGEDLVEFQVHGGTLLTQKILEHCLKSGARLAEGGEFSKRAFLNGKLSLNEAEAISDEINAESEEELYASLGEGSILNKQILTIQNTLSNLLASLEAALDYPEEDLEEETRQNIKKKVKQIEDELNRLEKMYQDSMILKNGVKAAIVGSPNVGKSSLLNALVGSERAIVTAIEGTTRDIICESITYNGVKITFLDTAGLRKTCDEVEQIGVKKSKQTINEADVVIFVLDGGRDKLSEEEKDIYSQIKSKPHLVVINKTDNARLLPKMDEEIEISAKYNKNIQQIKEKILNLVKIEKISSSNCFIVSQRAHSHIQSALSQIRSFNLDESMDIVAMQLKSLWQTLGKITGQTENEQIIDLIFSKFCLGK